VQVNGSLPIISIWKYYFLRNNLHCSLLNFYLVQSVAFYTQNNHSRLFPNGNNWKRICFSRFGDFYKKIIFLIFMKKRTFTRFCLFATFLSSVTKCTSGRYFITSFSCKISLHLFCFQNGNSWMTVSKYNSYMYIYARNIVTVL